MAGEVASKKYTIRTEEGADIEVRCPICAHDTFFDFGPETETKRKGFRHVTVGINGEGQMMFAPVRFKACSNCGYVVQNLILKLE